MGISSRGSPSFVVLEDDFRSMLLSGSVSISFDAALPITKSRFVNLSRLDTDAALDWIGNGVISDSDGATSSSAARNILEESIQQYKVMDRFDVDQSRWLGKSGCRWDFTENRKSLACSVIIGSAPWWISHCLTNDVSKNKFIIKVRVTFLSTRDDPRSKSNRIIASLMQQEDDVPFWTNASQSQKTSAHVYKSWRRWGRESYVLVVKGSDFDPIFFLSVCLHVTLR